MDIIDYYNQLQSLTGDNNKTVEQRVDEAFALNALVRPDDEVIAARFDSMTYSALTAMLDKENACHNHDTEMMHFLMFNAEAVVKGHIERSLKDYRKAVNPLIAYGRVPLATLEIAVARIVMALRATVFNHDRYSILDSFIRRAAKASDAGEEYDKETVAEMARELYRLDNLLSIHGADDEAILKFIPVDELLEIRMNPQEGVLKKDRIEYTRRWESIYYDVIDELDERFEDTPRQKGFCFDYWSAMTDLLAQKYRILWRNPHLMNPGVKFD